MNNSHYMQFAFSVICLAVLLVGSFSIIFSSDDVFAQEVQITAKGIGFESTTIIEFENDGDTEIETIRMWLGSDVNFKSFKTENGWTGKKTPQGVIVFTTQEPIKPGETVKFGIITDKPKPGINWKALDSSDKVLQTSKTLVTEASNVIPVEQPSEPDTSVQVSTIGILEGSVFKLVPEKPSVGANMRVTGDGFGANQKLNFYIGDQIVDTFETDEKGHFMFTSKVPETQQAERVEFVIKDEQENQKSLSMRLTESTDKIVTAKEVPLTIGNTPDIIYRGEMVKVSGTATPVGTVTATVKDELGNILTTISIDVDSAGNWEFETLVALDATIGKQTVELSDGKEKLLRSFTVSSSKKIDIIPTKNVFNLGQAVSFNGTAIPNQILEIEVEDPVGTEVFSTKLNIDSSGEVDFEFPTDFSYREGTYIVFAKQGEETEIILVGVGETAKEQLIVKMDKLNYKSTDKATVSLEGPPSSTVSLLIVDPSDKEKFSDTVTLGADGHLEYALDLTGYGSGVYTAVIKRANSQDSDVFSVGLQTGSGPIDARTTKDLYVGGNAILVLGNSGSNILLTVSLIDPDGNIIQEKQTFTDKDGTFSYSLKLPVDSREGTWVVNVKSGPNFDNIDIKVAGSVIEEGLIVHLDKTVPYKKGETMIIDGVGAQGKRIYFEVFGPEIEKPMKRDAPVKGTGEFETFFVITPEMVPGEYTIVATSNYDTSEVKFTVK